MKQLLESIISKFNKYPTLDTIYPVGSLYWSMNSTDPSELFGGTWERIKDQFILAAGDNYTAGNTGGEAEHTLSVEETPKHSHTRGTMEITGASRPAIQSGGYPLLVDTADGALYQADPNTFGYEASGVKLGTNSNYKGIGLNFQASRSWTGATSEVGNSQAHNNMPPYLVAYCWKRIS